MKKLLLIAIDSFLLVVDGTVVVLNVVKGYGLRVWANNAVRRWVLKNLDRIVELFRRFDVYLQKIEVVLHYRLLYANVTDPMKQRYKELRKKRLRR
jgi:hypothetical protein